LGTLPMNPHRQGPEGRARVCESAGGGVSSPFFGFWDGDRHLLAERDRGGRVLGVEVIDLLKLDEKKRGEKIISWPLMNQSLPPWDVPVYNYPRGNPGKKDPPLSTPDIPFSFAAPCQISLCRGGKERCAQQEERRLCMGTPPPCPSPELRAWAGCTPGPWRPPGPRCTSAPGCDSRTARSDGPGADPHRTRGLPATSAVSCGIKAWDWWAIGVGERRAWGGRNNSEISEADGDEERESNFWKGRELGQYIGRA